MWGEKNHLTATRLLDIISCVGDVTLMCKKSTDELHPSEQTVRKTPRFPLHEQKKKKKRKKRFSPECPFIVCHAPSLWVESHSPPRPAHSVVILRFAPSCFHVKCPVSSTNKGANVKCWSLKTFCWNLQQQWKPGAHLMLCFVEIISQH